MIENLERLIVIYEKSSDRLIDEIIIDKNITLGQLKEIFDYGDDEDMLFVYRIANENKDRLERILDIKFDLDKYDYHLDCYLKP